jgi:glycosyltransferase involved in cell wall biosynthesis
MTFYSWGGSEEYWHSLAVNALEMQHEVLILVAQHEQVPSKIIELQKKGAQVIFYKNLKVRIAKLNNLLSNYYNLNVLRKFAPDLIFISQGGTYEIHRNDFLLRCLSTIENEIVVICHGNSESVVLDEGLRKMYTELFDKAKFVMFPSQWSYELTCNQLLHVFKNYKLFANPLNLNPPQSLTPFQQEAGKMINIAMVGSLTIQWKGHDIILQTLSQSNWLKKNWHLNIYGDGKDKAYIESLMKYLNLTERVSLIGHVKDVNAIWNQNDLLVMPSRVENAPISIVEAMICGKPVVSTNIGGIAEWINEKTGYLAKAPNVTEFSFSLEKAFNEIEEWNTIGLNARKHSINLIHERTIFFHDLIS